MARARVISPGGKGQSLVVPLGVYMAFKGMTLLVYQRSRVPGSGLPLRAACRRCADVECSRSRQCFCRRR